MGGQEVTADQIATLALAIAGIVMAILKARGQARAAAMLEVVVRGVERGSDKGTKRIVRVLAGAAGIEGPLHALVERVAREETMHDERSTEGDRQ